VKFFPRDELPKSVCAMKRTGTPATGFPAEVTRTTDRFRSLPTTARDGASSSVAVVTFFAVVLVDVVVVVVVVEVPLREEVEVADVVLVVTDDVVLPEVVVMVVDVVVDDEVLDEVVELPEDVDDDVVDDEVLDEVVELPEDVDDDVVDDVVLPGSTTASQPFCMLSIPSQSMMQLIWNVPSVPAMNWIEDELCAVSITADFTEYPWTSNW